MTQQTVRKDLAVVILGICIVFMTFTSIARSQEERLIEGWGEVVDPDGDCEIDQEDGVLTISLPNTLHDLNRRNGNLNAPRVLQEVEGDFRIEVKVSGEFMPGNNSTAANSVAFVSAGILVWHDDKNYIRLERNSYGVGDGNRLCFPPLFELRKDGKYAGANPRPAPDSYFTDESTTLRLQRTKNRFAAYIQHGDDAWARVKQRELELPSQMKIGVAAINTSSAPLTVKFQDLKVTEMLEAAAPPPEQ